MTLFSNLYKKIVSFYTRPVVFVIGVFSWLKKSSQFNFSGQNLRIECNFFEWDAKSDQNCSSYFSIEFGRRTIISAINWIWESYGFDPKEILKKSNFFLSLQYFSILTNNYSYIVLVYFFTRYSVTTKKIHIANIY